MPVEFANRREPNPLISETDKEILRREVEEKDNPMFWRDPEKLVGLLEDDTLKKNRGGFENIRNSVKAE